MKEFINSKHLRQDCLRARSSMKVVYSPLYRINRQYKAGRQACCPPARKGLFGLEIVLLANRRVGGG